MAKHVFILDGHTWSFLSIFEAEPNLSDAYKKLYVGFVIKLFQCRKNSHLENRLSRWGSSICYHFLINKFHSQIKKVTQNEPRFTCVEYLLTHRDSQ